LVSAKNLLTDALSEFNYFSSFSSSFSSPPPPPPPPPQALQSVVDNGFQNNRPTFPTVSGYCLPFFFSL
jgi:hypothetical protein